MRHNQLSTDFHRFISHSRTSNRCSKCDKDEYYPRISLKVWFDNSSNDKIVLCQWCRAAKTRKANQKTVVARLLEAIRNNTGRQEIFKLIKEGKLKEYWK